MNCTSFARELVGLGVCAEMSGLRAHEMLLGVSPCERHDRLFARYRMKAGEAQAVLSVRIVADIRSALELGAPGRAADLLVVLRRCLAASGPDIWNTPAVGSRPRRKDMRRRGAVSGVAAFLRAPAPALVPPCRVLSFDAFRKARAGRE